MNLTGKNLIAGEFSGDTSHGFTAFNAQENQPMATLFTNATEVEVNSAITRANEAFLSYSQLSANERATFLRTIGEQIIALGDDLVDVACAETGLPAIRIQGERGRTVGQLNLFADLLDKQEYQTVIEQGDSARQPLPKPDTRLGYLPLGVVAVFGASNFPLAFSTAGGDTASALAAGCPIVMKAHAAHPGTAELVATAILKAIKQCNIDAGVFSLIQGKKYQISTQIVTHPLVKAVGFTGSERVGMILQAQINQRVEPIPFYGELGSLNPQFILTNKLANQGVEIAEQLVASTLMGQGQFCTSPGIWLAIDDSQSGSCDLSSYQNFIDKAKATMITQPAGVMLTPSIRSAYNEQVTQWQTIQNVNLIAQGQQGEAFQCRSALFATDLSTFIKNKTLQEEIFGACALIIKCADFAQMLQFVTILKGNLTASIHALDGDLMQAQQLALPLAHKVGRLIYNQMPTGVEVCASMNHGGPFPASTAITTTSVGSEAINRFRRPICYQNIPSELLPQILRD